MTEGEEIPITRDGERLCQRHAEELAAAFHTIYALSPGDDDYELTANAECVECNPGSRLHWGV
jgi:hypothetical protein